MDVRGISVEIVRKRIKNLHVGVYPPNGRVRVAAPLRLTDDAVRLAVVSRLGWIRRQQTGFLRQDRQSAREMVTGESHHVQGRRFRLRVVEHDGAPAVSLVNKATLMLTVRPGTSAAKREAILAEWYRARLREQVPALLDKWAPKVGVETPQVGNRRMKTRWGSCNAKSGRIWLNLELAKKPAVCLEYIVVHELVHLLERGHTDRFRQHMDRVMPNWQLHRDVLNRSPLAHEGWEY